MDVVGVVAQRLGFPRGRVDDLMTAVGEACLNAIEHGNHFDRRRRVVVRLAEKKNGLEVRVTDSGRDCWNQALTAPPPDLRAKLAGDSPRRGWGIFLIQKLVDEVEFLKSSRGRHQLRMVVYRESMKGGQKHGE